MNYLDNDLTMLYQLYEQMYLIRNFEMKLLDLFNKGELFGTIHACIGQEAVAVGAINALDKEDFVVSNHRGHGHYIAYSDDPEGLMAEIMGKKTGVVGGRGGSQHLQYKKFYCSGIQGGMTPIATGLALAEKLRKSKNIVSCFIGDGTFGQGILVENNYYAMSTHIKNAIAGKLIERGKAFGIDSFELFGNDVEEVYIYSRDKFQEVREKKDRLL